MAIPANPLETFVWGSGGAKKTPEQIAREREIATLLAQEGMDYSPVGHWTQGLARASQGLVGGLKNRWADEAEARGQEEVSGLWQNLFGGGDSAASSSPVAEALVSGGGAPASVPQTADAMAIRDGLIARGLPEHVADGFLMNMQDESGLNPGINEAEPLVPGSRGGYGLYQLTGPRRVAYEQFAAQRGVDPADVDAQLDFLMTELQGPEARAAESILAAPDAGTAAAAIARNFLRPAKEHLDRRVAAYTSGGSAMPVEPQRTQVASLDQSIGAPAALPPIETPTASAGVAEALAAQPDPMQTAGIYVPGLQEQPAAAPPQAAPAPMQTAQAPQYDMNALLGIASHPFASDAQKQIAMSLLGQQMEQQQMAANPLRQLQIQAAEQEMNAPIEVGGVLLDRRTMEPIFDSRTADGQGLINAGNGNIYNPNTGEWITAPSIGSAEPPEVETFFDEEGREYKAQWDAQTGEWKPVGGSKLPSGMSLRTNADGTVELVQGPGAGQKLTEAQGKDIGFYTRGIEANSQLELVENNLTDFLQANTDLVPLGIGNYMRTPEFRQAKVAADNFLSAVLRKDTGAAITPAEFDLYGPMFLPIPGDDPATMQQKRRMRDVAMMAINSGLGTAETLAQANRIALGLEPTITPRPESLQGDAPAASAPGQSQANPDLDVDALLEKYQ